MAETTYGVYVKADAANRIVAIDSDYYLDDTTGWTKIDEGTTDKYKEAKSQYFVDGLMTHDGIYRFALDTDEAVERPLCELNGDRIAVGCHKTDKMRIAELEQRTSDLEAAVAELLEDDASGGDGGSGQGDT